MEDSCGILLLLVVLCIAVDAVNPGCECLVYSATYGKEYGTFSSPDYPRPYPPSINCLLYTFIAGANEIIELIFKDFDVQKTQLDCARGDFVKLFLHADSGLVNEYTPWSGVICGGYNDIPHVLYSSGPAVVLEFHTDALNTNSTGFVGTFRFIDRRLFQSDGQKLSGTLCDHQFISSNHTVSHGRFYSPRYPSSYPKNVKCVYRFKARTNERVRIVFEEVTLQKGDLSCLIRSDIIKVYDGWSAMSPAISLLCNEAAGIEVMSTGSELYIEFVSNSEWPGQGFKATFQFQSVTTDSGTDLNYLDSMNVIAMGSSQYQKQQPPKETAAVKAVTAASCDVLVSSDTSVNGTVTSPGYPSPYPARSSCRYDFQGHGKQRVQLVFNDFHLYHPSGDFEECEGMDVLMAYVLIDGRMEKIDDFCGTTLPRQIMSNGPRLMMEFRGVYSSRYAKGFKATYSFIENFGITTGHQLTDLPCAFEYNSTTAVSGSFSSPNFPGLYPRDTECHYMFYGQNQQRVLLHFHYFDVEGVFPCEAMSASDYVEFSNFLMTRDRKYPRHCGTLKQFEIESDRKFFRVTFRSNDRLDGTGFNATYHFLEDVDPTSSLKPALSNSVQTLCSDSQGSVRRAAAVLFLTWVLLTFC